MADQHSGHPFSFPHPLAVEKNPNAVVTLQHRAVAEGWGGRVTVVPADMRAWQAPEQADILVR